MLSQEWADLNMVEVGECEFSGKERVKVKSQQQEAALGQRVHCGHALGFMEGGKLCEGAGILSRR